VLVGNNSQNGIRISRSISAMHFINKSQVFSYSASCLSLHADDLQRADSSPQGIVTNYQGMYTISRHRKKEKKQFNGCIVYKINTFTKTDDDELHAVIQHCRVVPHSGSCCSRAH